LIQYRISAGINKVHSHDPLRSPRVDGQVNPTRSTPACIGVPHKSTLSLDCIYILYHLFTMPRRSSETLLTNCPAIQLAGCGAITFLKSLASFSLSMQKVCSCPRLPWRSRLTSIDHERLPEAKAELDAVCPSSSSSFHSLTLQLAPIDGGFSQSSLPCPVS
jgi:hypothetical protein